MAMTKKDYEILARTLKAAKPADKESQKTWLHIVAKVESALTTEYRNFNLLTFQVAVYTE